MFGVLLSGLVGKKIGQESGKAGLLLLSTLIFTLVFIDKFGTDLLSDISIEVLVKATILFLLTITGTCISTLLLISVVSITLLFFRSIVGLVKP